MPNHNIPEMDELEARLREARPQTKPLPASVKHRLRSQLLQQVPVTTDKRLLTLSRFATAIGVIGLILIVGLTTWEFRNQNDEANFTAARRLPTIEIAVTGTPPSLILSEEELGVAYATGTTTAIWLQGNTDVDSTETPTPSPTSSIDLAQFCTGVTQIPQIECEALMAIYAEINDVDGHFLFGDWLESSDPCRWNGVQCTHPPDIEVGANIQSLFFEDANLNTLPPEIGNLKNLVTLYLGDNNLDGVPSEIGNLTNLAILHLNDNNLDSVPSEIGNLINLQRLDLSNNELDSLPPEIGNLNLLEYGDLSHNNLSSLPPEIVDLTSLFWLDVSDNSSNLSQEVADMPIAVFSGPSDQLIITPKPHISPVHRLVFDPTGDWLVSGSHDSVRFWDLQNPEHSPTILRANFGRHGFSFFFVGYDSLNSLALDPTGRWLADGSSFPNVNDGAPVVSSRVHLWDLQYGDKVTDVEPTRLETNAYGQSRYPISMRAAAFDPQGRWLAAISEDGDTVQLWDGQASNGITATASVTLTKHAGGTAIAFDPSGQWLVISSCDGAVQLWDLRGNVVETSLTTFLEPSYECEWQPNVPNYDTHYYDHFWVPGRRYLAVGNIDGTIALWDWQNDNNVAAIPSAILAGHEESISSLAFDPSGQWLASSSYDGTVRLWNVQDENNIANTPPVILTGHEEGEYYSVAFGPTGRWLAAGHRDGTIWLWDLLANDMMTDITPVVLGG